MIFAIQVINKYYNNYLVKNFHIKKIEKSIAKNYYYLT